MWIIFLQLILVRRLFHVPTHGIALTLVIIRRYQGIENVERNDVSYFNMHLTRTSTPT